MSINILKIKNNKNCYQYTYYKQLNKKIKKNKSSKEEVLRCSSSRSSSLIKDYILNNDFDYFFTLTLKSSSRYDILYSSRVINNFIRNYSKKASSRGFSFKFLYVFEKTKKERITFTRLL